MKPPPLPIRDSSGKMPIKKGLLGCLLIPGGLLIIAIVLRLTGDLGLYRIPTNSMNPTLTSGDNIVSEGISYWFREPVRGEVIVFDTIGIQKIRMPQGVQSQVFMKRLVGLPGDEISIRGGKVYVNGAVFEPHPSVTMLEYTNEGMSECVVPDNVFFVLGDNSANSFDSRSFGFVPVENVKSRIFFRLFPSSGMIE